ncbi:MAG: M1 family metallopeptidase [Planctomycetes bacterium]|nr:M1 family metallopeptidase [Planctomycetota bacterium]
MRRAPLALSVAYVALLGFGFALARQDGAGTSPTKADKFRQLEEILPTPNEQRTASGAPGSRYWQQKVDYSIEVKLDESARSLEGAEVIRYWNRSPDVLSYLWVQLDMNLFAPDSHSVVTSSASSLDNSSFESIRRMLRRKEFDGSARITAVRDASGGDLPHTVVGTMMRVDLPAPLHPGDNFHLAIDWNYRINNAREIGGRTGYEVFEDAQKNCIFEMAQWFPRLAAYTDVNGWQHKQYLGSGEFTLEFGDYRVAITVPEDHVVAASGVLQNAEEVLSPEQRARWDEARASATPKFVITPEEAKENEGQRSEGTKTWRFAADNVRDFAWASSRKFIWDCAGHEIGGRRVDAMSFYPKEAEPLWSKYSTQAICHTLDVYSEHTFDYPYPTAISVNGPVGGMEYPMICFNGPRPEKDGTYSKGTKYGLISVVIHEVGHNFFPMIVNSDERQWAWMDEGINTFLQYLAEQRWEDEYPSSRGEPRNITGYMGGTDLVPIMTSADSVVNLGSNAYAKPATALNVLRETVMGRELFDFAFKTYAQRWMFKRPEPADFFRTMEDASAVDLDWFWRGWFYGIEKCDLSLSKIRLYTLDTRDPNVEKELQRETRDSKPVSLSTLRNAPLPKRIDAFPELADFYNTFDDLDVTEADIEAYAKLVEGLKAEDKELLQSKLRFYVVDVENKGGLPSPVVLEAQYEDGTREELRVPAEVWRRGITKMTRIVMATQPVKSFVLDPHLETADVELSDNVWPPKLDETRLKLEAGGGAGGGRGGPGGPGGRGGAGRGGPNPMREAAEREKKAADEKAKEDPPAKAERPVEAGAPQQGAGSTSGSPEGAGGG